MKQLVDDDVCFFFCLPNFMHIVAGMLKLQQMKKWDIFETSCSILQSQCIVISPDPLTTVTHLDILQVNCLLDRNMNMLI